MVKRKLESSIEDDCVDIARKEYRWWGIKFKSLSSRGAPDRLFIGFDRLIFFVEFKQPKKKPTGLQKDFHRLLRLCGFNVYVVDNEVDFRAACESERQNHQKKNL